MRLVFCLLALGASAQEARLDDVLELMEKRTRGVQDLKVTIVTRAERAIGLPHSQVTVAWVRDAGLRVRGRFQPEADGRNFGLRLPRGIDVIYTADRIRLIQDWDDRPGMGGLAFQALAIRTDDPAFKSHDPMLLPTSGYPIRMMVDEPIVYAQMAPRLMLGMEPNLALEGKRMEGSRSCFVLVSSPAPRDPKLPRPGYFVQSRRKQFFVDAQSGSLVKIRWELSFSINLGGAGLNEQRMVFQSEVQGEQNVVGGFSLPESIRWSARLEGRGMGGGGDLVRGIAPGRVNAGLAPAEILTAAEKDDLYGDAVLRRAEDYEAMVRKDPGDAEAHYALAQCRGAVDPLPAMVPGGAAGRSDAGPLLAELEAATRLRPKADGPVLNLLSIYRSSGDTKGEREMLERVEKLAPTNRMRLWAAAHWVALAEGERAEKLLAGFEPASREEDHQAAVEALFVAAVRGRPDRALELFGEEASRRVSTAEKFEWIRAIEARASSLPDALRSTWTAEAVGALLDRGQKVRPGELVYRLARSSLLRSQGKTTAAAAELLEAAPEDPEAVARALEVLDPVRMPGAPGEAPAEPQADPDAPRLVAALGKVARGDPRLPYQAGRALAGAGKPQEARTMYEAALEACRTTPPGKPFHAAAMRVALLLGSEKGPEGWREKCVEVFLSIGKAGGAVPQDILLDEARSPIGAVLTDLVARKEWSRFYRMASASIRIAGANYLIGRHREGIEGAGLAAIKSEVWKEKDPEKFIEFADFLEGFHEGPELVEALERAHALAPKDLEIFERLAHKYLEGGPAGKAKAAVAELLPQVPADRRAGLQMELAQYFLGHQEPAKAQETLSAISLPNLDGPSAIRCAELLGQARDWDRAIAACRRAYETGLKPHFQMGRCFEMKKEFYEAFRYYNRDRLEGSSSGPPDPESEVVVVKRQMRGAVPHPTPVEPDPTTGQEARDRLLKELGSDWLLKRFLDQPFAPLGGEEERRLKAALEKLSSDAVDDRDSGVEALRSLGPQATPLLRPLLKSTDEEVKTRVRQLLQEWSEPR